MNVRFYYNFNKRKNSTKRPSSTDTYNDVTVNLKNDTDMNNPVFIITTSGASLANIEIFTYAYVSAWSSYFFVDSVRILNTNTYEFTCSIDVLATYRSQIEGKSFYIERCSDGTKNNGYLEDSAVSSSYYIKYDETEETGLPFWDFTGCFLLRTCSNIITPANITYMLTLDQMITFIRNLLSRSAFESKIKYISMCKWAPIKYDYFVNAQTPKANIYISDDSQPYLTDTAFFGNYPHSSNISITRPTDYYGDFRDYSPRFCRLDIELLTNRFTISPGDKQKAWKLYYAIDFVSASFFGEIKSGSKVIASLTKNIGYDVELSSVYTGNIPQSISAIVSAGGSMVTGNVLGLAGSAINGITAMATPHPDVVGTTGNAAEVPYSGSVKVTVRWMESTDTPSIVYGKPTMKNIVINTISKGSFVKCGSASIDIAAHSDEIDAVNNYLNNGFYYE